MIAFTCVSCQKKLAVHDDLAGKQVQCPDCGKATLVPNQAMVSAASSPHPLAGPPVPASKPPNPGEPAADASLPDLTTDPPPNQSNATRLANHTPEHDPSLIGFLAPRQADDELGRLGGFLILKILGHGGM
jgi:DNA-directed RNA polymerase subunit RPC12/RpoP